MTWARACWAYRRVVSFALIAMVAASTGAGCGREGDEATGRLGSRDRALPASDNSAARPQAAETWSVEPEPLLELGSAVGDSLVRFHRISHVSLGEDSLVAVADGGAYQIKYFTLGGSLVNAVGRRGQGPEEFRSVHRAFRCESAVAVLAQRTIKTVTARGMVGGVTLQIPPGLFVYKPHGCVGGHYLMSAARGDVTQLPSKIGPRRDSIDLVLFSMTGELGRTVGRFPRADLVGWRGPGGGIDEFNAPFARSLSIAVTDSEVVTGIADDWTVRFDGLNGRPARHLSLALPLQAVDAEDVAQYKGAISPHLPDPGRPAMQRELDGDIYPKTMPAYSRLAVDDAGNVWMREYDLVDALVLYGETRQRSDRVERWKVMARDGRFRATLALPAGFELHQATGTHLLGVWLDEADVEHVQVYRLLKSSGR